MFFIVGCNFFIEMKRNHLLSSPPEKTEENKKKFPRLSSLPLLKKKEKPKIRTINFLSYSYIEREVGEKKKRSECTTSAVFSSTFSFLF